MDRLKTEYEAKYHDFSFDEFIDALYNFKLAAEKAGEIIVGMTFVERFINLRELNSGEGGVRKAWENKLYEEFMKVRPAERPVVSRLDCTNILKSETCRCGGSKVMNRAFCFHCWNRLPRLVMSCMRPRMRLSLAPTRQKRRSTSPTVADRAGTHAPRWAMTQRSATCLR